MTDIKRLGLISPFALVPSASGNSKPQIKQTPRQPPTCNCDSDEENDFGMARECAFVCNNAHLPKHHKSKKRRLNAHAVAKKTKRVAHNDH
jgi:hypothetical protein